MKIKTNEQQSDHEVIFTTVASVKFLVQLASRRRPPRVLAVELGLHLPESRFEGRSEVGQHSAQRHARTTYKVKATDRNVGARLVRLFGAGDTDSGKLETRHERCALMCDDFRAP